MLTKLNLDASTYFSNLFATLLSKNMGIYVK